MYRFRKVGLLDCLKSIIALEYLVFKCYASLLFANGCFSNKEIFRSFMGE